MCCCDDMFHFFQTVPYQYTVSVLTQYIRSLTMVELPIEVSRFEHRVFMIQSYIFTLVINLLVHHNRYYQLHQVALCDALQCLISFTVPTISRYFGLEAHCGQSCCHLQLTHRLVSCSPSKQSIRLHSSWPSTCLRFRLCLDVVFSSSQRLEGGETLLFDALLQSHQVDVLCCHVLNSRSLPRFGLPEQADLQSLQSCRQSDFSRLHEMQTMTPFFTRVGAPSLAFLIV